MKPLRSSPCHNASGRCERSRRGWALAISLLWCIYGGKVLFLNANKEIYSADIDLAAAYIPGILPPSKVELSNYYTKAEIDNLLLGKAPSNHVHAFSVYSNPAGHPPHQHLVEGDLTGDFYTSQSGTLGRNCGCGSGRLRRCGFDMGIGRFWYYCTGRAGKWERHL